MITRDQRGEIARLQADGHTAAEIARILSVYESEVQRVLTSLASNAARTESEQRKREKIRQLYEEGGCSQDEIAAELKMSRKTVAARLVEIGLHRVRLASDAGSIDVNSHREAERLRADLAVLENRVGFRWFQRIDEMPPGATDREVRLRVVDIEGDLRVVVEMRGRPCLDENNGISQRSYPFSAVEAAVEGALSFLVPPPRARSI